MLSKCQLGSASARFQTEYFKMWGFTAICNIVIFPVSSPTPGVNFLSLPHHRTKLELYQAEDFYITQSERKKDRGIRLQVMRRSRGQMAIITYVDLHYRSLV